MTTLPQLTDEEIYGLSHSQLIRKFRELEGSYMRVVSDRGSMMKDLNQRMQLHLIEIRSLKDVNRKLQDDSQELRDLCCFLDDDRQKARKLAREWQRFGKYTSSVMRSEVAAYQHKLQELERQQESLMEENLQLKELCLFLDGERESDSTVPPIVGRAEGDGSSSSSSAPDKLMSERGLGFEVDDLQLTPVRDSFAPPVTSTTIETPSSPPSQPSQDFTDHRQQAKFFSTPQIGTSQLHRPNVPTTSSLPPHQNPSPSRGCDAITNAREVLKVYEELENPSAQDEAFNEEMSEAEKAIVREMCNVVWRKLGDAVPGYNTPV